MSITLQKLNIQKSDSTELKDNFVIIDESTNDMGVISKQTIKALSSISDTDITNLKDGQALVYDSTTLKWTSKTITTTTNNTNNQNTGDNTSDTQNKPIITFIDDDGTSVSYTRTYPLFKSKGVSATFAIVTDWIGNSGYMTVDQLKQLQTDGFTLASHSKTHNDNYFNYALASTSDSILDNEFASSKQWFSDKGLGAIDTIVYPHANFDTHAGSGQATRVENIAKKYYSYGVNADGWYNTNLDNKLYIKRWFPDFQYGSTLDQVKSVVDNCINEKGWLIFGVHAFNSAQFPDNAINEIIDYIKSKGVDIMNFKNAAAYKEKALSSSTNSSTTTTDSNNTSTTTNTDLTSSFIEGFWLGEWASSSKGNIAALVNTIGRTPKVIHTFVNSNHAFNAFSPTMDYVNTCGCINLLTMELQKSDGSQYSTVDVNNGTLDSYFTTIATSLKSWQNGKTVLFRPMHEVNGNWYGWAIGDSSVNTNETYINAFRRIVNIFKNAGAANVKFVYNINCTNNGNNASFMNAYPGDNYVDYVSIDGYNWGTTQSWSHWQTFDEIFSAPYSAIIAATSKPMLICEYGCTESGGDKPSWITDAVTQMKSDKYKNIKGAFWFNENKETDWRVNSSDNSLSAYKSAKF